MYTKPSEVISPPLRSLTLTPKYFYWTDINNNIVSLYPTVKLRHGSGTETHIYITIIYTISMAIVHPRKVYISAARHPGPILLRTSGATGSKRSTKTL